MTRETQSSCGGVLSHAAFTPSQGPTAGVVEASSWRPSSGAFFPFRLLKESRKLKQQIKASKQLKSTPPIRGGKDLLPSSPTTKGSLKGSHELKSNWEPCFSPVEIADEAFLFFEDPITRGKGPSQHSISTTRCCAVASNKLEIFPSEDFSLYLPSTNSFNDTSIPTSLSSNLPLSSSDCLSTNQESGKGLVEELDAPPAYTEVAYNQQTSEHNVLEEWTSGEVEDDDVFTTPHLPDGETSVGVQRATASSHQRSSSPADEAEKPLTTSLISAIIDASQEDDNDEVDSGCPHSPSIYFSPPLTSFDKFDAFLNLHQSPSHVPQKSCALESSVISVECIPSSGGFKKEVRSSESSSESEATPQPQPCRSLTINPIPQNNSHVDPCDAPTEEHGETIAASSLEGNSASPHQPSPDDKLTLC